MQTKTLECRAVDCVRKISGLKTLAFGGYFAGVYQSSLLESQNLMFFCQQTGGYKGQMGKNDWNDERLIDFI